MPVTNNLLTVIVAPIVTHLSALSLSTLQREIEWVDSISKNPQKVFFRQLRPYAKYVDTVLKRIFDGQTLTIPQRLHIVSGDINNVSSTTNNNDLKNHDHPNNSENRSNSKSPSSQSASHTDDMKDDMSTTNKDIKRMFQDMLELDANIKENLKRMVEIESAISTESKNKLHTIINEQITSSAVDQIRDSQEAAHKLAKELLLDVLQDRDTPHKFGILLTSIFSFETVLLPTRDLIYWSILLPSTIDNSFQLTKTQVIDYWLNHPDCRPITHNALVDFSYWWLTHPLSYSDLMLPLIKWSLKQREMVVEPISKTIVTLCQSKQLKETSAMYLKQAVLEGLKSPQFKKIAKERVVEYIKLTTTDVNSEVIVTDSCTSPIPIIENNNTKAIDS